MIGNPTCLYLAGKSTFQMLLGGDFFISRLSDFFLKLIGGNEKCMIIQLETVQFCLLTFLRAYLGGTVFTRPQQKNISNNSF